MKRHAAGANSAKARKYKRWFVKSEPTPESETERDPVSKSSSTPLECGLVSPADRYKWAGTSARRTSVPIEQDTFGTDSVSRKQINAVRNVNATDEPEPTEAQIKRRVKNAIEDTYGNEDE